MRKLKRCGVFVLLAVAACSTPQGWVPVTRMEGALLETADRHDAYVQADPKLTELQRRAFLLQTQLLREVVAEAKKP